MPSSTPLAAPGMSPLARLCDLLGFGPTPAAILFPIRGAAFQKVTQLSPVVMT